MRSGFTLRWVVLVAIGEALGFAVAVGAAITAILLQLDDVARLALIVPAGAIEGALLATGQYLAMRDRRPHPGRWIGFTAVAASVAWLLGMLPSTIGLPIDTPGGIALLVAGGLVLLATIPLAQWIALQRSGTFRWVPITMGGWAVAILWTAAPSPFIDESSPVPLVAALFVVAGLLMALTIAVLTAPIARTLFDSPASALPSAARRRCCA